ncbi:MAG TPA: threonine synthase [Candidatus Polarisedimenticolia bacterium]|nr:threonine synthase [Candidatus Polarisedimenticolia bacterium]
MSAGTGRIDRLECGRCGRARPFGPPAATMCLCGGTLLARYDLAAGEVMRARVAGRPPDLWRYAEVLPPVEAVSLGEGFTPLLDAPRLGAALGMERLLVKDESQNPTGSFKARGMTVAVSVALAHGVKVAAAPSAGNAGSALAAYGARAGMEVRLYLPESTPSPLIAEARRLGARVTLVPGSIADAGKAMRAALGPPAENGWFDFSTLREPFRVEGKKTMGYELFEQLDGRLPDVILYPTGGGTGLIGMWKAFDEMQALGWIGTTRPRMVSVQSQGCAPIPRAFAAGTETAEPWSDPVTVAWGLRVPGSLGDALMLRALRESRGDAVAVSDEDLLAGAVRMATLEGIDACPEGGACVAALQAMLAGGRVGRGDLVVLFNTGSGIKYAA